jgi:hypothetical protein
VSYQNRSFLECGDVFFHQRAQHPGFSGIQDNIHVNNLSGAAGGTLFLALVAVG